MWTIIISQHYCRANRCTGKTEMATWGGDCLLGSGQDDLRRSLPLSAALEWCDARGIAAEVLSFIRSCLGLLNCLGLIISEIKLDVVESMAWGHRKHSFEDFFFFFFTSKRGNNGDRHHLEMGLIAASEHLHSQGTQQILFTSCHV